MIEATIKGLPFPKQKQLEILLELISLVNSDHMVLSSAVMDSGRVMIKGEFKEVA